MGDADKLSELRRDSGKKLPISVIHGLTSTLSVLQIQITLSGGRPAAKRSAQTAGPSRIKGDQKLKTLEPEGEENYTKLLNDALQGSSDYPLLTAALGAVVSGPAGLLFAGATTALSMAQTSARVLGRQGDEIWRVEEIGKTRAGSRFQPTYVLAYFLVDPFREKGSTYRGWLIHEDRYDLVL